MFICGGQKGSGRTGLIEVTELCLVRHGSTDWNNEGRIQGCTDTTLNDQGRDEALQLGKKLKGQGWEAIISSNLRRARETAEIIGGELGVEVMLYPNLREREFGPLEGKTRAELAREYPGWPQMILPGLESKEDLRCRAEKALTFLACLFKGHRLIVVSHGGFFKAFLEKSLRTKGRELNNAEAVEILCEQGIWRFR